MPKDPGQRYADAEALADDLAAWLRGDETEALPMGRVARLRRWYRRSPALALTIGTEVRYAAFSPDGRSLVAVQDREVRLWPVGLTIGERKDGVTLWVQVLSGLELTEHGASRPLEAAVWQSRRQQFEELISLAGYTGGPLSLGFTG